MVNTIGVPYEMTKNGLDILKQLQSMTIPDAVLNTDLTNIADITVTDAPKFIPSLVANDFKLAKDLCETGRAVTECAKEISLISKRYLLAIVLGGFAIGGTIYLFNKIKKLEKELNDTKSEN